MNTKTSGNRPNILFAIADDASHMSAYGHRFLNTPNFDRVAKRGVLFNNSFTTNPKCAPSRASILTGRHTWQLEEACNHWNHFKKLWPVYTEVLEENGWFVGITGKGWGPGNWKDHGWKHNPAGKSWDTVKMKQPDNSHISPNNYTANFKAFLDNRPDDAPFCFWYGCFEPHRPYVIGEGLRAGKSLESAYVPPYWPDDPMVRCDILDYAREIEWFDDHLGAMLEELEKRGELENTLVIVTSDNGMPFPRVKGAMYEDDFRLPLAVCWPDRCPGGRISDDLVSFRDFAPTMLEAAGVRIPESFTGKSFLNILTSDKSGIVDPSRDRVLMGRERHDMGREGDLGYPVRCLRTQEWLYIWNCAPERWPAGNPETGYTDTDGSPTKSLIVMRHESGDDAHWKYCFGMRPGEELYKVKEDPHCMNNLADDPAHAEIRKKLRETLLADLREQGDPRMNVDKDYFEGKEYIGGAPHSWDNYKNGVWKPQGY